MKKIILILVAVSMVQLASAQFNLGIKIGYNTSKPSIDQSQIKTDLKNSFQFGVFTRLGNKVYVQPELNWLTQGGIFKDTEGKIWNSPFKQTVKLNTVQVPVMIGYKLINLKIVNLRGHLGPVASFVTDKTIKTDDWSGYIDPIKGKDVKDILWSAQIGMGVDVLMFSLDIRYNIGLTKMIKEVQYKDPVSGEMKTTKFDSSISGFNITLGWKII